MIQRADDLVVPAASRRCFAALASLASVDKTYMRLPSLDHDAELQPERGSLDDEIAEWIARHIVGRHVGAYCLPYTPTGQYAVLRSDGCARCRRVAPVP